MTISAARTTKDAVEADSVVEAALSPKSATLNEDGADAGSIAEAEAG